MEIATVPDYPCSEHGDSRQDTSTSGNPGDYSKNSSNEPCESHAEKAGAAGGRRGGKEGWKRSQSLEKELAREPHLALKPTAVTLLKDAEIEVLVRTLFDGYIEIREVFTREGNTNRPESTIPNPGKQEQTDCEPGQFHQL